MDEVSVRCVAATFLSEPGRTREVAFMSFSGDYPLRGKSDSDESKHS